MSDTEQLVVPLVAKVDDFERNFKRAGRTATREFSAIEDKSKQAAQRLEANMTKAAQKVRLSLGTLATAFGAGALLGGLTQLPDAMRDVVKGAADIGRQAERVGILTDELQGLQYGFQRVGIDAGASYDAIQEFAKRVAEAASGSGELKDILAANGVALRNSDGSMRSTMALLRDYAGLIGNASSEAERLLLADKGFSNMEMASAMRDGASSIDSMIYAAKGAGAVLDAELIAKAQDVDIEFANLSRSLETFAKEKSIEFMSALSDMGGALADFAAQIGVAWTKLDDFWNDVTGRDMEAVAMQQLRGKLTFKKFDKSEDFPFYQFQPTPDAKPTITTPVEATVHGGNRLARASGGASRGGGGGGGASGPTGYEKILEHVREFIAQQGVEQSAVGKTAQEAAKLRYEQDLLNQATRAGIQLSPQQRAELGSLAATMAQAEQATRSLTETQQAGQEAGQFFGQGIADAFTGIITGASTAQDAIKGLIDSLIQALVQAALLGDGPLGGLFGGAGGGLLGGLFGFSAGGYTGDGGKYEPKGVVHGGEYVFSKEATSRLGRDTLERLHSGHLPGFAAGGFVDDRPPLRPANSNLASANDNAAPVFQISAPITVNGSSGTPEQNTDLAKRMRREMEAGMRSVVADELRKQTKSGNVLNTRSR